jgi:hypothetical protein
MSNRPLAVLFLLLSAHTGSGQIRVVVGITGNTSLTQDALPPTVFGEPVAPEPGENVQVDVSLPPTASPAPPDQTLEIVGIVIGSVCGLFLLLFIAFELRSVTRGRHEKSQPSQPAKTIPHAILPGNGKSLLGTCMLQPDHLTRGGYYNQIVQMDLVQSMRHHP